jgi:hypothetical protein
VIAGIGMIEQTAALISNAIPWNHKSVLQSILRDGRFAASSELENVSLPPGEFCI